MKVRLGYPDRVVEVTDRRIYLFNGRLLSAPIEEALSYYTRGEGLLHPELKAIVPDVVRILLRSGESSGVVSSTVSSPQTASG